MSNIPLARWNLNRALKEPDIGEVKGWIRAALKQMVRERPDFVCPAKIPPLTPSQRLRALHMRNRLHMPMNDIARKLGTNLGRISTAVNRRKR